MTRYLYHVQMDKPKTVEQLLEILRYMDVLTIDRDEQVIVHQPRQIKFGEEWAHRNADRAKTFVENAEPRRSKL